MKTKIDELPQLINILTVTMSIVGPQRMSGWSVSTIVVFGAKGKEP